MRIARPDEGEVGHVHDRLVAQLQRVHTGLPGPHLAAGLAAAGDRRGPGVRLGLLHEALDGARPGLHIAYRVAAGEHHTGDHPVADRGLAGRGEDHALVAAQREVAERVPGAVPGEQLTQLLLVVVGQPGRRVLGAEGEVRGGGDRQQAERAEGVADGVVHMWV